MSDLTAAQRIEQNVVIDDRGCWLWQGARRRYGYGVLSFDGRPQAAHRLSYSTFVGPIPGDLTVDHLCFVPACVNPEHLRLLTRSENSRNQRKAFKTHCSRDHALTPENTYRDSDGHRHCRECNRIRQIACRARRAGAAA